jgi:predicted nucleotide-binding protein
MTLDYDSIIKRINDLVKEGEGIKPNPKQVLGDVNIADFNPWRIKVLKFLKTEMNLPDDDDYVREIERLKPKSNNQCIYKDREVKSVLKILNDILEDIKSSATRDLSIMTSEETTMPKGQSSSLPRLKIPKNEARKKIESQIEKGREISDYIIENKEDLEKVRKEKEIWHDYNTDLLKAIFDNEYMASKYNEPHPTIAYFKPTLALEIKQFKERMDDYITRIESILERLELISEPEGKSKESIMNTTSKSSIFIVHGADKARYELESLLREWELEPIILDDKASKGRTIIEKFEDHSSEAQCAIVLLTPDDEGRLKNSKEELKPRARQNVILELGYFYGRLGRNRVICLYKNDIEIPSDIGGIAYIPFSDNLKDEVYRRLRTELKAMELTIKD